MIGGNNLCVRFNRLIGFDTCFMKLITSQPKIFSQMGIKCIGVNLMFFSQMNILVSSHKILVCENTGKCPACECFHKTSLLHYPIILDVLYQRVLDD